MKICQCHGHCIIVGDVSGRYEGLSQPQYPRGRQLLCDIVVVSDHQSSLSRWWTAACILLVMDCSMHSAGDGLQHAFCWWWTAACILPVMDCSMHSAGDGLHHAFCWWWTAPCILLVMDCTMHSAGDGLQHAFCWWWTAACILLASQEAGRWGGGGGATLLGMRWFTLLWPVMSGWVTRWQCKSGTNWLITVGTG